MSACDVCQEREAWAVAIEEPEQHEPIRPGGLIPDRYSCRLVCVECGTKPPWTEIEEIDPYEEAVRKWRARRAKLAALIGAFVLTSGAVDLVGGSTIVDVAQGSELIELPAPSVEDKLRDQLGLERDRHGARINRLADTNRALRTQLRIERKRTRAQLRSGRTILNRHARWTSAVEVGASFVQWARGQGAGDRFALQVRRVAGCEAGGGVNGTPRFDAVGPTSDLGALQYIPPTWRRTAPGKRGISRTDPHASVMAAAFHFVSPPRGSTPWGPWSASRHCHGLR